MQDLHRTETSLCGWTTSISGSTVPNFWQPTRLWQGTQVHPASHKLYTPISGSANSNASPTVSLTSPKSDGQFAVGSNVSITATAADSDGSITKVEFYNGTTLLGTDTSAPYSYTWSSVKAGEYNLTAKATDNKGAITISNAVQIKVASNTSPTVSITSLKSGGQLRWEAASLSLQLQQTATGRSPRWSFTTAPPYSAPIPALLTLYLVSVKAGEYNITAKATDNKEYHCL